MDQSFEELRQAAFERARDERDLGFFWDLVKHLRASASFAAEDGSMGGIGGSITDAVEIVRELLGKDLTDDERALLQAKFENYLARP